MEFANFFFRNLLSFGKRFQHQDKEARNLLKLIKIILEYGCRLSNFVATPNAKLNAEIIFKENNKIPFLEESFLSNLYSILSIYSDARLASHIAELLYIAGADLNPEIPKIWKTFPNGSNNKPTTSCQIFRDLAQKLNAMGNGRIEQEGDIDLIAFLLHAASEPRSLQECAISTIRTAMESEISQKVQKLKDAVPSKLLDRIQRKNFFTF